MSDFYVDDILTGADTIQEAKDLQTELIQMLRKGGFPLRKWCANDKFLLEHLPPEDREAGLNYNLNDDHVVKTLGLYWNSQSDTFQFTINLQNTNHVTKRTILSEVSRLFDPLGLVSPVVIKAKMILQELWKLKLSWDETIPHSIHTSWTQLRNSLSALNHFRIPRHIGYSSQLKLYELHTFSDAPDLGYGACIYLRIQTATGDTQVTLICSKTKVAPIKPKLTTARLELCGAVLAAQLTQRVITSLKISAPKRYYWSDSKTVLSWIHSPSTNWNTFVSNRISKIQQVSDPTNWRHVRGGDNPADLASRGTTADILVTSQLWWHGPVWLSEETTWDLDHKIELIDEYELPERKSTKFVHSIMVNDYIIHKYSSLTKLLRMTALFLRFINNSKTKDKTKRNLGELTLPEIQFAMDVILRLTQRIYFDKEYEFIKQLKNLPKESKPLQLSPFLDANNLIRVGGRLQQANLPYDHKHPILLPERSPITKLIIKQEHIRQLHLGPQSLLSSIRTRYWPINGKKLVKRILHECIICFRARPKEANQLMGPLPSQRIHPSRAFLHVGIDYCGPINILTSHRRGAKSIKGYIALFVCMSTRALHLELVQEYTSKSFIAALQRFISRRGRPNEIWSDNAKNFIGANNEIKYLYSLMASNQLQGSVRDLCFKENIRWNFIPPRAPHFGGLWEAGVKSVKHLLVRNVGTTLLTYEELYTVLCRIEGCLNSRPITSLSTDPDDPVPLTPGHFLIGEQLTAIPEKAESSTPINTGLINRWRRINQIVQHFWNRWRREYLSQLQSKVKWRSPVDNIKLGTIVIIHEDNVPPLKWILGRVVDTHPGPDGRVRVVTIKTAQKLLKRSIKKICPLPIAEEAEEEETC